MVELGLGCWGFNSHFACVCRNSSFISEIQTLLTSAVYRCGLDVGFGCTITNGFFERSTLCGNGNQNEGERLELVLGAWDFLGVVGFWGCFGMFWWVLVGVGGC